jgi:hypothetical protein
LGVSEFIERSALLEILHVIHKAARESPYSHRNKNIHIVINILFMAFPQPVRQYFHGIPAVSGRFVNGAAQLCPGSSALSARRTVFIMRVNNWQCPGEWNDHDIRTSSRTSSIRRRHSAYRHGLGYVFRRLHSRQRAGASGARGS